MSAGSIRRRPATTVHSPLQVADETKASASARARARSELTEGLAARILEHISAEGLAAGTHLAAQDLADRFNVSRSPVNQALRLLHEKGVLAHQAEPWLLRRSDDSTSAQELGLTGEDDLNRVYLQIADDRLHGRLPAQVSESQLRERYGLTRAQLTSLS